MALIAANCPTCGADIQIPDDRDSFDCKYCGQKIVIEREEGSAPPSRTAPEVKTYMDLAETAEASGNSEEAHKYFSMVLERDPKNLAAWVGKGLAAGWQSTLASPRLEETLTCIRKATALGMTDKVLIKRAAEGAHKVAVALYNQALNHSKEFERSGSDGLTGMLEDAAYNKNLKIEFAGRALPSIELAGTAWKLQRSVEQAHDLTTMCVTLINMKVLNESALPQYQRLAQECEAWGKQHDPEWEKKRKTGCFVATATMGNYDHPTVLLLRTFRDQCLAGSCTGRRFIDAYYDYGPRLADVIRDNRFLRRVSYLFIVAPMACVARIALRKSPFRQQGK